jgi:hypothetical protein
MPEKAKGEGEHAHFGHRIPEDARQHLRGARDELRESVKALLPPEFVAHRRAARREMLLAARSLIDHVIKRLDEASKA